MACLNRIVNHEGDHDKDGFRDETSDKTSEYYPKILTV
jgi:hypothetical protein